MFSIYDILPPLVKNSCYSTISSLVFDLYKLHEKWFQLKKHECEARKVQNEVTYTIREIFASHCD